MQKLPSLKWHGSSHIILMISKFYGTEIGLPELREINTTKFVRFNSKRELFRLELFGFIKFTDVKKTRWEITNAGVSFLYNFAKFYRRTSPMLEKDGA